MSKLIDADALIARIDVPQKENPSMWQKGYFAASSNAVHEVGNLPDASKPLQSETAALRSLVGELGEGLHLFEKLEEIKDRQASAVGRRGTKRGIAINKDEEALLYQALDIEAGKITDQIAALAARAKEVTGK